MGRTEARDVIANSESERWMSKHMLVLVAEEFRCRDERTSREEPHVIQEKERRGRTDTSQASRQRFSVLSRHAGNVEALGHA